MMYHDPRVISDEALDDCVKQIQDAETHHNYDPVAVIGYLAFMLGQGTWFTDSDAGYIFKAIGLQTHYIDSELYKAQGTLLNFKLNETVHGHHIGKLYSMHPKTRQLYESALKREPEPERAAVSTSLTALRDRVTDPQEQVFLDETLLCLECGACRSAIVMGWNLTYYHLSRWICDQKCAEFNGVLITRNRTKTKKHDRVTTQEELADHKESFVLDIAREAGILATDDYKVLKAGLDTRNRYAHPSTAIATPPISAGHLSSLLEHIVVNVKFR